MLSEVDIGGLFMAPIVVYAAVAMPLFIVCRWALRHLGVQRRIWHPELFDLALYLSLLSLLILAV